MVTLRISITETTEEMVLVHLSQSAFRLAFIAVILRQPSSFILGDLQLGDDQGQDVFDVYGIFGSRCRCA